MRHLNISILACILASLFVGCAASQQSKPMEMDPYSTGDYLIGAEDVLEISVWQNQDVSRTVTVRPDGLISLPLVGDVSAAGLTPEELKHELTKALIPYMEDPNVAVIVQQINSWRIYIQGEVRSPGVYPIRSKITVTQAITLAGGFTEFAKKRKLQVIRRWKTHTEFIKVNYNKIASGNTAQDDVLLRPGDTLVVP